MPRASRETMDRLERSAADPRLARAAQLARWTDTRLLDPIVGFLLPGAGDLLASGVGLYIVSVAMRLGLPGVVIARMLMNLGVDALLGAVPLAGDLFDVAFQANRRNLALLEAREERRRARPSDWLVVAGAAVLFLAALAVPVLALIWALRRIF